MSNLFPTDGFVGIVIDTDVVYFTTDFFAERLTQTSKYEEPTLNLIRLRTRQRHEYATSN